MSQFSCTRQKTSDIIKAARNDAIRTLDDKEPKLTPLGWAYRERFIELGEVVPTTIDE